MTNQINTLLAKRAKGQVLVLMGLLFIGLIAVVGLAIDLGLVFVAYSRLNRAVDAAALAATGEFKRNYQIDDMRAAARQMLALNNVDLSNSTDIEINTCKSLPGDSELCTTPQRKLVRVVVNQDVPLYFLSVVGIHIFPIQVKAVSEAASLDVMLVLDNSPTMAFNAPRGPSTPLVRDPIICNSMDPYGTSTATPPYDGAYTAGPDGLPGECHPFEEVKWASISFANRMNFEYDRLGIVTFNRMPHIGETIDTKAYPGLPLYGNIPDNPSTPGNESEIAAQTVIDALKAMTVYEGSGKCPWTTANKSDFPNDDSREPCSIYRIHDDGVTEYYWNVDCPSTNQPPYNPERCTLTNIGGALSLALSSLQGNLGPYEPYVPFVPTVRKEAVWVIIILSDGRANAGYDPDPICPSYTWLRTPQCRDKDPYLRRPNSNADYDAEDFARDVADVVAQNSVFTFAIGFGNNLMLRDDTLPDIVQADANCIPASTTYNMNNPFVIPAPDPPCSTGQELMGYLAVGAANKVDMPTFAGTFYNVGNDPDKLERVFLDIYNKLTTKLTK